MVWSDLLIAWLNVAFDHKTLYQPTNIRINLTAVKNFFGNTDLLLILLVPFFRYALISTAAGESVNGYIKKAVDQRMERESN